MEELLKSYEELGKRWILGENINSFNNIVFNEKQFEFVNDRHRYSLVSGGFASGKTTAFIVKLYLMSMFFPGNRILLGAKTKQSIETKTLPDIIDVFPQGTYEHKVGPGKIVFPNGSEILFFGLDALQSGAGQDIKKAEQAIKSLNLGAVFIDQLEEIEYRVFEALTGRMRRKIPFQQMNFATNPANFWAYDYFKANPRKNTHLVETSMLDNRDNLSQDFIDDQLSKDSLYVQRYVYGDWSPDSLVEGGVFAKEYIKRLDGYAKPPIRTQDGMNIFVEPQMHEYQIGVDPSTGSQDPSHICVVDKETGEEVANYSGFVPINVQIEKTLQLCMMYSRLRKPLVIPEITGVGQSFVDQFKKVYERIYEREVFNHREKKKTNKLGFSTNHATKMQLIEHFKDLLQKNFPIVRDKPTVDELKTFIYSDEARQKGAGAQTGYHDDRVMGKLLAYWNLKGKNAVEQTLHKKLDRIQSLQKRKKVVQYKYS
jgi:hypothetical protein